MKIEGVLPKLPYCLNQNNVGIKFVEKNNTHYLINVFHYNYIDNEELVWTAEKWLGYCWRKIPTFTRTDERKFPKFLAKIASEFLLKLKAEGR